MLSNSKIVDQMIVELKRMPIKSETTVSDLIWKVAGTDNLELSIDDLFIIDEQFRKKAIASGYILDSMAFDEHPVVPFDMRFVIRKI